MDDPAADLAIVISILSSLFDVSIDAKSCFAGEMDCRAKSARKPHRTTHTEAKKLGYKRIYISSFNPNNLNINGIEIIRIAKIEKFLTSLFSN